MSAPVIVVRFGHDPELDYHDWWCTGRRVKADRIGRLNPNMTSARWMLWQCNNIDCSAQALVDDSAVAPLIDRAAA